MVPAQLHLALVTQVGPRGLNRAVADGLRRLLSNEAKAAGPRPSRDEGSIVVTLRLPVQLADDAERLRSEHGITRQALVEYALLATLVATA